MTDVRPSGSACRFGAKLPRAGILVCLLAGCSGRQLTAWNSIAARPHEPTSMVMTLTPSIMAELEHGEQYGMLARVYFFNGEDPTPVKVDGRLSFVAYDRSKPGQNRPPDGTYSVSREEMPKHLRKDVLGPAYVCWLPFNSGRDTQVVVQSRFHSHQERELVSRIVTIDLKPTVRIDQVARRAGSPRSVDASTDEQPIVPVNYEN